MARPSPGHDVSRAVLDEQVLRLEHLGSSIAAHSDARVVSRRGAVVEGRRIVLSPRGVRSKHAVVAILAVAAILSSLGLAACGTEIQADKSPSPGAPQASASIGPGGDVDDLMAQVNTLVGKSNDLTRDLWEQGQMMEVLVAPDAAAAEPELAKARSMLDEVSAAQKAIVSLLDQVVRLHVGEELTIYAGQQKEIAELQLLGITAQYDLLEEIGAFYLKNDKPPGEADFEELFAVLEPSGPDDPLARFEEKGQASREYFRQSGLPERYYINNGLGEAYDTSSGPPEDEGWEDPFPHADGIELVAADPMEDGGWKEYGYFEPPVAEAMQAQRAALEAEGWSVKVTSSGKTRGVMTARKDDYVVTFTFKLADPAQTGEVIVRLNHN